MEQFQLNLFGEEEEVVKKEGDKGGKKGAAKSKTVTPTAPSDEQKVVPAGCSVAYAGHQIEVDEEITLENLRKRLERDFPELSKERTKMFYDEERRLVVPVVTGGKKG